MNSVNKLFLSLQDQFSTQFIITGGCRWPFALLVMVLLVLPVPVPGSGNWAGPSVGFAQEAGTVPPVSPEVKLDDQPSQVPTILTMIFGGNVLGLTIVGLILLLSVVSVYFIIEHFLMITRRRLMPDSVLDELERLILHGEVNKAIELCNQKENYSMATELVLAGLNRYKSSEFGFAEYRSAVEEAGEDQTGKLYRRTEVLNVIGAIAPMLGLTGTVVGMIEAFTTIASLEGMARPQELAGGIGQALITTLLGLVVAIPTMVAFSFFRNKIDSIVAEAGKRIERVMMPLGRKRNSPKVTK